MKQKKLHTAVRYALTGLTLFTTSLLVQAQEVTEETTEAKDLERIAVVGARGAPRSVVLRVRLADAHAAKGQFDRAVEVAKKALVLAVQGADGAAAQQIRARIVQYERQMEVGTR